ncbi:MAG: PP2C family protein-serine/threonine phosphatase [Chitinivibrionales bacterium]|nr:PP2C family protein-serine/threonine phosphatase [Chitinivibrionales bacterium]
MNISTQSDDTRLLTKLAENEQLKNQLMMTSLINDLVNILHAHTTTEAIYQTLLLGIEDIIGFDRIIFFSIDKEKFCLVPTIFHGVDPASCEGWTISLGFEGGEITDALFLNRHVIITDPLEDEDPFFKRLYSSSYALFPLTGRIIPAFNERKTEDESVQLSPKPPLSENDRRRRMVQSKEFKTHGAFWMDRHSDTSPISSEDISAVSLILAQVGLLIENVLMKNELEVAHEKLKKTHHELNQSQAKINKDLEHARTIQRGLLPQSMPTTADIIAHSSYIPADAVGGDYYDVFEISPSLFGMVIADVSGHGVSSALIMSMVKALLKTFAAENLGPQKTLERINSVFNTQIRTTHFVTVFYATIDTNRRLLTYTSAGHCPALLLNQTDKTIQYLKADGLFLGVFPDMMLHEVSLQYVPHNQRIVLYTDGLTEATDAQCTMFDLKRLENIAKETLSLPPVKACEKIITVQKQFCGRNSQPQDDITLLVVDY